jgi:hypothetical protein
MMACTIFGGVSLLTSLHLQFLESLTRILPEARVRVLVADQEADDDALCKACGKSREQFRALVESSIRQTQLAVEGRGWRAEPFTGYLPDLAEAEQAVSARLLGDNELSYRLTRETIDRAGMYSRIGQFSSREMLARTVRTAAQYIVLGQQVRKEAGIIINHTTTNLAWYAEADVAVVHNPVCVY